ncbi:MAG: hypothetical protein WD995_05200 [Gemmatimonadota bacterium]
MTLPELFRTAKPAAGPVRWTGSPSVRALGILVGLLLASPVTGHAQADGDIRPPGAERSAAPGNDTCTTGRISAIEIDSRSIFDPEGTPYRLLSWAYSAANALHVNTRDSFIERELLFEEGDCLDPFLLSESERLLDQYGFLAYARVEMRPDGSGGHIASVTTRDEWSTQIDLGVTYDEGTNVEKLQVTEENFLGHGVFGEFTYLERRESRTHSFGVSTPRFFGRADAGMAFGRTRSGTFFEQHVRYPFVGEAGRVAVREGYSRGTDFFAYSTGGQEQHTRVLVPILREQLELSSARRFGEPGRSVIVGASLTRDVVRYDEPPEVTLGDGYGERFFLGGPPPPAMARQWQPSAATRLGIHFGTRRFRYEEYVGLDGVRDRQTVGLGLFAGVSLAQGIPMFAPAGVDRLEDLVTRAHASFTAPLGSSLLHGGTTFEARRDEGRWKDVLSAADLVFYGRSRYLPGQTWFARASFGGGWNTELPYQLSLGGREAVRALPEDVLPGGRMLLFILEDRIALAWPGPSTADLGVTVFGEAGRMFPGDVPYGVDSGWQGSAGFGLRIGLPPGTRNIWRADIVFPVGSAGGSPIFRMTFELNKFRSGFFNPEVRRSRRFMLGPESF